MLPNDAERPEELDCMRSSNSSLTIGQLKSSERPSSGRLKIGALPVGNSEDHQNENKESEAAMPRLSGATNTEDAAHTLRDKRRIAVSTYFRWSEISARAPCRRSSRRSSRSSRQDRPGRTALRAGEGCGPLRKGARRNRWRG